MPIKKSKNTTVCSKCGQMEKAKEFSYFENDVHLCAQCLDEYTATCEHCHARIWLENNCGDEDIDLCQYCFDAYYTTCYHCGKILYQEDICWDEINDLEFCQDCYPRHGAKQYIDEYDYKPEPIFYGTGLYLGIELEIDQGGLRDDHAKILKLLANEDSDHLYIKEDSSLKNGFELVSHPMSLDYHLNSMPWRQIFLKARELGYLSHDCETCGLHVNVGRNELGDSDLLQDEVIGRLIHFFEFHWDKIVIFSRRTSENIDCWAARYGAKENPKAAIAYAKKILAERNVAINLLPGSTIEFRLFRGTLRYSTFMAVLQFVKAVCQLAMKTTDEELVTLTWEQFLANLDEKAMPELINYLQECNLFLPSHDGDRIKKED